MPPCVLRFKINDVSEWSKERKAQDVQIEHQRYLLCAKRPLLRLIAVRLVIRQYYDSIIAVLTDLTRFMHDQGFSPT